MAGEMSTGLLAMAQLYRRRPAVSMLVVGMEAKFYKKATGSTRFTCSDGIRIRNAVQAAIDTGEPQTIKAHTIGHNQNGEPVAEFFIEWSFKRKK